MRSAITNSLFFLLALGLSVGLTYRIPWGPPLNFYESIRWRKGEYYDVHAGEFDVVFAGSSQMGSMVLPELFDEIMAEYGVKTHSFNFGIPGDEAHHTEYLIRRKILREDGKIPEYVFIDPRLIDIRHEAEAPTRRELIWNSPYETYMEIRSTVNSEMPARQKSHLVRLHIKSFLNKYVSVSKGINHANDYFSERPVFPFDQDVVEMIAQDRGYNSNAWHIGRDDFTVTRWERQFLADNHRNYYERVDFYRAQQAKPVPAGLVAVNRAFMKGQVAGLEASGVGVIYVTLPTFIDFRPFDALSEEDWFPAYLPFHSADATGWGYDISLRFDILHLNDENSLEFTRRLARRFATEVLGAKLIDG